VDFELPGIADAAVSLLVERIEGLHVEPRALVYPFSVVERASTTRP
jgi:DNA-binding LacI/PurR family transcriptional regulator